ncbi:SCY1-like protein 1 [Geosmithia morbida]|uniref:SCY1-like protein 1 n=1 Tax=Geosmithia morbida TaxID=1094350 RepID=A0A9P4YZ64_9HYPO|nr:SCY1-like protein 1 [Geosmithia morbida]KAF4125766.1 SCY1-like protein 1 [Geosmithia morbida]
MDFLKSAMASAMASGPPFPYSFGDRVDVDNSVWALHNGTKKDDGSNCSIFSFDISPNRSRLPLAKNALRKMRTLRHPGVIKVLDTVETESYIYIATERVVPLRWHVRRKSLSQETIKWGLHGIAVRDTRTWSPYCPVRTISFINGDASSIHGSLRVSSVYTSESGEWKLGGFEVLSSVKDDESAIYTYGSLVPDSARYSPPEVAQNGWDSIKKNPIHAVDAYNYAILIYEAFNGEFAGNTGQPAQTKGIPPTMHAGYRRLCNANPKARISVSNFLEQGIRHKSFFDSPLIKLTEGIDSLGVKTPEEREQFLVDLGQITKDFPEEFLTMKVLPELMKSVEFGDGGPNALKIALKTSAKLSGDDYDTRMVPFIVRLFSNPDRAIRACLLDDLNVMIDRLPQKVVNDKIFPQMVAGFTDAAPLVRELTVKSVLVIITKLSDRTINGDLLRQLAKTANDEQPGIRTNTTICLGKIAKNLGDSSRSKVLIAAFTRSLRDPFVHARNAALMALGATVECFSDEDCAGKILPAVCPMLLDRERLIRDSANRSMEVYLQRVRKAASGLPDTAATASPGASAGVASGAASPRMATPQANEGPGWTGWAISSFTNKLSSAAGDMQTSGANGSAVPTTPSSVPTPTMSPGPDSKRPATAQLASSSASSLHRQAVSSPRIQSPNPASVAREFFPDAATPPDADDGGDSWGGMADDDGFSDNGPSSAGQKAAARAEASATPFEEGEPDFASWLAERSQKKSGPKAKALPKGLSKSSSSTTAAARKPAVSKPASKPVVAKKIDLKPKETDDDDAWGDGWD